MGRMILVSGPSCIGKGPLFETLWRCYPDLAKPLRKVILYNDREIRPIERDGVDFFFRTHAEIEALGRRPGFLTFPVRDDLQALETASIQRLVAAGHTPFYEGNHIVPLTLLDAGILAGIPNVTIFLSPLSREEILFLRERVDLGDFVQRVQRHKLLRRTRKQKGELSHKELREIERRSGTTIDEMRLAWRFDAVIPLYNGEGDDNWDAFDYPIGSARAAVEALAVLLRGENESAGVEHWESDLVPD
jgi:guanylate kinase